MSKTLRTLTTANQWKPSSADSYVPTVAQKHGVVNLSNGAAVYLVIDGTTGYLYYSTNRDTVTNVLTITGINFGANGYAGTAGETLYSNFASIAIDSSNNIYLGAAIMSSGGAVSYYYTKFTWSSGSTWTQGSVETVGTYTPGLVYDFDIDVTPDGIPIMCYVHSNSLSNKDLHSTTYTNGFIAVRRTSDSTWIKTGIGPGEVLQSIAADLDGKNASNVLMVGYTGTYTSASSGYVYAGVLALNVATGALDATQPNQYSTLSQKRFGDYANRTNCATFAIGSGEFFHCGGNSVARGRMPKSTTSDRTLNLVNDWKTIDPQGPITYMNISSLVHCQAWFIGGWYNQERLVTEWSVGQLLNKADSTNGVAVKVTHSLVFFPGGGMDSVAFASEPNTSPARGWLWDGNIHGFGIMPTGTTALWSKVIAGGARKYQDSATSGYRGDTFFYANDELSVRLANIRQETDGFGNPLVMTLVSPSNASILDTGTPTLKGLADTSYGVSTNDPYTPFPQGPFIFQYLAASDSGFTSAVKYAYVRTGYFLPYGDNAFYHSSNSHYGGVAFSDPGTPFLPSQRISSNGTTGTNRFLKARALSLYGAKVFQDSSSAVVGIYHLPSVTALTPDGGISLPFNSGTIPLGGTYADSDPNSTITQARVKVTLNDGTTSVVDTGLQAYTGAGPGDSISVPVTISSSYKDTELWFKFQVTDDEAHDGILGPTYGRFYLRDLPAVAITVPSSGGVATSPAPSFTWTFTASGGRTQANYRVVITRVSDGSLIYDSGVRTGVNLSFTLDEAVLVNGVNYQVTLFVTDSVGLTSSTSSLFSSSFTKPASPFWAVDTSHVSTDGYVGITWDNSSFDSRFIGYRIYRRVTGAAGAWALLFETNDTSFSNYLYKDYLFSNATTYDYVVVQAISELGVLIESDYSQDLTVSIEDDKYWLIPGDDPSENFGNTITNALPLPIVVSDTYTDEYEETSIDLIGRGRRHEYGTHYGVSGSLTVQVLPLMTGTTYTGRALRLQLEAAKLRREYYWLRNPFGDFYKVATSNLGIDRIAGTGAAEGIKVTIHYEEVGA